MWMKQERAGAREVVVSSQAEEEADLVVAGGEVGEVIQEVKTSWLWCGIDFCVILIFPCFSFAVSVLLLEAVDTAVIGATVTGVTVKETSGVAIGAMAAVADTEVVEDTPLATETIGRS